MGQMTLLDWNVSHFTTVVNYRFDKYRYSYGNTIITPGVQISLSDVGDSSYILKNLLEIGNGDSLVLLESEESRRHSGELDTAEFTNAYIEKCGIQLKNIQYVFDKMQTYPVVDMDKEFRSICSRARLRESLGVLNHDWFCDAYPKVAGKGNELDVFLHLFRIPGFVRQKVKAAVYTDTAKAVGRIFEQYSKNIRYRRNGDDN